MQFIPPKRLHESNIQAEAYRQLRNNNIKCCLEYTIHCKEFNSKVRSDIVIIEDGQIILIIECKSRVKKLEPNFKGRQYQKYQSLSIPVIYCMNFTQAKNIADKVMPYLSTK